jgi:hypothetical protein
LTVVDLGQDLTERVKKVATENHMSVAQATRFLVRKAFQSAKNDPRMIVVIPAETFLETV